jgi:V/A-type H+-transporting ATPase subunit G/H
MITNSPLSSIPSSLCGVDFAVVLSIITVMKLIEDIKKAEEKAEKLKKEARDTGEELLEKARKTSEEALAALDEAREKLIKDKLAEARMAAEKEIKKAKKTHETELKKIRDLVKSKKDQAVKKVQEILLTWPSSQ